MCLALNVYFEARGEPIQGQAAVAHVTITRARERNLRICDVVFEPGQFSWTIHDPKVRDEAAWATAMKVAKRVYHRRIPDPTAGANHYHATRITPRTWDFSKLQRTAVIGRHVFYTDRATQVAMATPTNRRTQ